MSRPIVKVCGVTAEEEIEHLGRLGVDFFGLVVDVPSPWTLSAQRSKELAARAGERPRPTLVTGPNSPETLVRLVDEVGARAIQLGVLALPRHVAHLRRAKGPEELTIIQEMPFGRGRFGNEDRIEQYRAAGADLVLLDKLDKAAPGAIPEVELAGFRDRNPAQPTLVAGDVSAANVRALLAASGAVGVDVCSSVRRDGRIRPELVAELLEQLPRTSGDLASARPSLRDFLGKVPRGNHVVAYLTIGDPPERFREVAAQLLAAGALTLELGLPFAEPVEGACLSASHRRALAAGWSTPRAMEMLNQIGEDHPRTPLIAVVQWPAIESAEALDRFLDDLAQTRAAAVLPVGMSFWQLARFAERVHACGLQTVIPFAPTTSRTRLGIALRYCSGCLYVPRGRTTGGGAEYGDVAEFCRRVAGETDLPIIVGVGVNTAAHVEEICRTPAKAAAVGSALVDHIAHGGSASDFLRRLTTTSQP